MNYVKFEFQYPAQMNVTYKIGLVYCKAGQKTEEEMYNNGELMTFRDFRHLNVAAFSQQKWSY